MDVSVQRLSSALPDVQFCTPIALSTVFDPHHFAANPLRVAARLSFPSLDVQLLVAIGLAAALLLFSIGSATFRIASSDRRFIFIKSAGYRIVNMPLIAALMLSVYSVVAIAGAAVSYGVIAQASGGLPTMVNLLGLLPAPIFVWAWTATFSAVTTCHVARNVHRVNERKSLAYLSFSPRTVNLIGIIVPTVILVVNIAGFAVAVRIMSSNLRNDMQGSFNAPNAQIAAQIRLHAVQVCHTVDLMYRLVWGSWALAFTCVVIVYVIYSLLMQANLQDRLAMLASAAGEQSQPQSQSGSQVRSKAEIESHASSTDILKALRKSLWLSRIELCAFTFYCLAWIAISCVKIVRGINLFVQRKQWGTLVLCEFYLAAICAFTTLSIVAWRDFVLWRARKKVTIDTDEAAPESDSPEMAQEKPEDDMMIVEQQMINLLSPIVASSRERSGVFPEPLAANLSAPDLQVVALPTLLGTRDDQSQPTHRKLCSKLDWRAPQTWQAD